MRLKASYKLIVSFVTLLLLFQLFAINGIAAETGELLDTQSDNNGFVNSISISFTSYATGKGVTYELSDYEFFSEQNSYTVNIPSSCGYDFYISVPDVSENYWYSWKTNNGEWSEQIKSNPTRIWYADKLRAVPTGDTWTCYLTVGLKYDSNENGSIDYLDDFYVWDAYEYNITSTPSFTWPWIFDNSWNTLQVSPSFNGVPGDYFVVTDASTIIIDVGIDSTIEGGTNNVPKEELADGTTTTTGKYYINQLCEVEVSLDDSSKVFWTDESKTLARIPIIASYVNSNGDDIRNTFNLYVARVEKMPEIDSISPDVSISKGDSTTLTVEASFPKEATDIRYQWTGRYTGASVTTEKNFNPPSDKAGVFTYTCVITCKLAGVDVRIESDPVTVTVGLGEVNSPNILKSLGYLQPTLTEDDIRQQPYETEYYVGTNPYPLTIQMEDEEPGCSFSFDLYYNDCESTEGGILLDSKTTPKTHGFAVVDGQALPMHWYQITPKESLPEGTWYLYTVITAAEDENPDNAASTVSNFIEVHYQAKTLDFNGSGTEAEPYLLENVDDLVKLRDLVADGDRLNGIWFQMANDISLPSDWTPIGTDTPFGGNFDGGGNTITVATEGKPLFARVSEVLIQNLNIYGEKIDGCGLVDESFLDYGPDGNYWTGVPESMTLRNIHLLSGSSTKRSGLAQGSGSGANTVRIQNCTVDADVVIGYTKDEQGIGSFIGVLNGYVENCVSYAEVYGGWAVGGIAGRKGQAMGACSITNCAFLGKIGCGSTIGGIISEGYVSESAPNTPVISVNNCYVVADLTGFNKIGGILGAESGIVDAWNAYKLSNNYFYGTITTTITDEYIEETGAQRYQGGIIGYYNSFNKLGQDAIKDNYYYEASGAVTSALGGYGGYVLASSVPERGFADETEFQAFLETIGYAKTAEEFADGSMTELLNAGSSSLKNWVQDGEYPIIDGNQAILQNLTLTGDYQTEYYIGDELDMTGAVFTATWSDGKTETVSPEDIQIDGYDNTRRDVQTLTASYGAVSCEFTVTVLKRPVNDITVYFTLLGDTLHEGDGAVHTRSGNNLTTWLARESYTVDLNATVKDLLDAVETRHSNVTFNGKGTQYGWYVESVTYDELTLGEFDNTATSGWMFTVNGVYADVGVSAKFLEDGDNVVFHFTDDYTKEQASEDWNDTPYIWPEEEEEEEKSAVITPDAYAVNGEANAQVTLKNVSDAIDAVKTDDTDTIVVAPVVSGSADKVSATLPARAVSEIVSDSDAALLFRTESGEVRIPNDTLAEIVKAADGSEIVFTITKTDAADVKEQLPEAAQTETAAAVIVTITSGGREITSFGGKTLEVLIPVDTTVFENGKTYTAYILSEDGSVEQTTATVKDGYAVVIMSHFSTVVITGGEFVPFTDIDDGFWAYDAILYAYNNGLMIGVGNDQFAPDGTMNRAMLVTILYRLEGQPTVSGENPFDDVMAEHWYTDAIIWAAENGLVEGYGNGKFGPEDDITREQMAKILYAYTKYKGCDSGKANDLAAYTDAADISGWALNAMQWANAEGLIVGRTATTIVPAGKATRAEAATILMRYMENVVK